MEIIWKVVVLWEYFPHLGLSLGIRFEELECPCCINEDQLSIMETVFHKMCKCLYNLCVISVCAILRETV